MNTLEHTYKQSELFNGTYFGVVIDTEDPDKNNRVKVRVYSVYELPIKKKDIPWAVQGSDEKVCLGDEVSVRFIDGDVRNPVYRYKVNLSKNQVDSLKKLYKDAIDKKKEMNVGTVTVLTKSFTEPQETATGELTGGTNVKSITSKGITAGDENPTGEAQEALLDATEVKDNKVTKSVIHPSGTFIDIKDDGSVVIHGAKHIFAITETGGDVNGKVGGDVNGKVGGDVNGKVGGDVTLDVTGEVTIKATNMTISAAMVTITGGTLVTNGAVAPTGSGPYCAVPVCLFAPIPHVGNTVAGT